MNRDNWKINAGFFIAGQFISMFGSMLVQYAITWHITLATQSGIWMTLFSCAGLLPMVLISPFAGVWADRYNRKYLINISDSAIALVTLIPAFFFIAGFDSILLMLIVVIVRGIGQGVQQPAVSALIPQIVPEQHLTRFNGINTAAQSLTMFAAPMLAGLLFAFLPIQYIFFIDVFSAIIGVAVVFFCVHLPAPTPVNTVKNSLSYFSDMKAAFAYIAAIPWLKSLFAFLAFFCICITPAAMLTPLQVTRSFGSDVWRLSAIEILFSVGMMLGGIAISISGGFKNKIHTMSLACIAFGFATFLFGIVHSFWLYLAVMLLCGFSVPLFNSPAQSILQSKLDHAVLGRVFSLVMMINGLAFPIGMAIFGPLSDLLHIELLMSLTGILIIACGLLLSLSKALKLALL